MIFHQITLKDYGLFSGEQSLNFHIPIKGKDSITLIGGLNGSGKTTIFESIQVCLFGAHAPTKEISTSYNKFIKNKKNRLSTTADFWVELVVSLPELTGNNDQITIRRKWTPTKNINEELIVSINGEIDTELSENWNSIFSQIVLPNMIQLFHFDGEKIVELAKPEHTAKLLKDGITKLLNTDVIESLQQNLRLLAKQLVNENDPVLNATLDNLQEEINSLQKDHSKTTNQIIKIEEHLEEVNDNLQQVNQNFSETGGDYYQKRSKIEKDHTMFSIQHEENRKNIARIVSESLPLHVVSDQLKDIQQISKNYQQELEESQRLKFYKERDTQVKESLKQMIDDDQFDQLERLLKLPSKKLNPQKVFVSHADEIDHLLGTTSKEKIELSKLVEANTKLSEQIFDIADQKTKVPEQQEILSIVGERENLLIAKARDEENLQNLRDVLATMELKLNRLKATYDKQIDHALSFASGEIEQRKISKRITQIRELLAAYNLKLLDQIRGDLEKSILDKFNALLRKKSLIDQVIVEDSFDLKMKLHNKEVAFSSLSAGERQLLASAILWTLVELSGVEMPVIIDTPLGRLDSEHRKTLINRYFPFCSSQVAILSTDTEIIDYYYEELSPFLGKQYLLTGNAQKTSSTITEGYF